ncbi:hypothetical protein [Celerinatantimonas yamalensis]|uniref:Reverse transcriptase (RNA-dependent DNA polymerase) n=1 Tax=Celerinatantimonas yamalensis TaxID=559956 RepID=A0ABW9G2R9_9GAMM
MTNITFKVHTHPKHRFQNLYGLLNTDSLYQRWEQLNKQAAPGIDGMIINHYQQRLVANINCLSHSLFGGVVPAKCKLGAAKGCCKKS